MLPEPDESCEPIGCAPGVPSDPDASGTGDRTPEQTPEEAEDEEFAALKSEFSQALANLIAGIVTRLLAKQESKGRVIDDGAAMK